jgi:hypothetical protein
MSLSQQEIDTDVTTLHKAMKGFGTDEKALILVLGRRTDYQMQQVRQCFKASYAKDLSEELAKETSGDFKTLCVALSRPAVEQDCLMVHTAIKGLGTKEELLMEVIVPN